MSIQANVHNFYHDAFFISFFFNTKSFDSVRCVFFERINCIWGRSHTTWSKIWTLKLHFCYILAALLLHFCHISETFWVHFRYFSATFWIHFGYFITPQLTTWLDLLLVSQLFRKNSWDLLPSEINLYANLTLICR